MSVEQSVDLIAQHKTLLSKLTALQADVSNCGLNVEKTTREVADLNSNLKSILDNRDKAIESAINSSLAQARLDAEKNASSTTNQLKENLIKLVNAYQNEIKLANEYVQTPKTVSISKRLELVKVALEATEPTFKLPESLTNNDINNSNRATSTIADIKSLQNELSDLIDTIGIQEESTLVDGILNTITFGGEALNRFSNTTRFWIFIAYVGALLLLIVSFTSVVAAIYSVSMMAIVLANLSKTRGLLSYVKKRNELFAIEKSLKTELDTCSKELSIEAEKQIDKKYKPEIKQLKTEIIKNEQEMKSLVDKAVQNVNIEELSKQYEMDYVNKINTLKRNIQRAEKNLKTHKCILENTTDDIERTKQDIEAKKREIIQAYLSPSKPGTADMLMKTFLCGLTESGELIELNYDGNTSLIIYTGADNSANEILIKMLLVQLFANMSPTAFSVSIVDTTYGCKAYQMFYDKELKHIVSLITTNSDVTKLCESTYLDYTQRRMDILSGFDTIEDYNKHMLANKSLAYPYNVLLLQDMPDSVLSSEEFLQLCRVGPSVGIIPLIFYNHTKLNAALLENSASTTTLPLIESITENFFKFDSQEQTITKVGIKLKQELADKILANKSDK